MDAYDNLNDVYDSLHIPEFKRGETEIWYARLSQPVDIPAVVSGVITFPYMLAIQEGWVPDFLALPTVYHAQLGSIDCKDLERIFAIMQGEIWSPHGEARNLIRSHGLDHTSMSIGDVIKIKDQAWMVAPTGFSKLVS